MTVTSLTNASTCPACADKHAAGLTTPCVSHRSGLRLSGQRKPQAPAPDVPNAWQRPTTPMPTSYRRQAPVVDVPNAWQNLRRK